MEAINANEIFNAAALGQVKKVEELLDAGVDVDLIDSDRNDTALHFAASQGQKDTMELLVERGASVNVKNNRGQTPLHALVKKRFDLMALWLIRQGADITIEDEKSCTARDYALDWFQKEMDEAAAGILPEGAEEAKRAMEEAAAAAARGATSPRKGPNDEIVRVFLRNGLYKTVVVTPDDVAREVAIKVAKKMGAPELASHLDIVNVTGADGDHERRMTSGENVLEVKAKWKENEKCQFLALLKKGTPAQFVKLFRESSK